MKCPNCASNDVCEYSTPVNDKEIDLWECNVCGAQFDADDSEPRIMGMHSHLGTAWMSDDFDEE